MAAEQRVNNRRVQSAAAPRAAESYTVDLTSVCIRSGTVRLPLSLLGRFEEGEHTVMADGEELLLAFEPPRTLTGLAPFFQLNELRTNDQVRFEFDGDRLVLHGQKRERARAANRGAEQPAGRAAGSESRSGDQPRHTQRLSTRGLYETPSELVDDADRAGEPGEAATTEANRAAAPDAPSEPQNQIRAVRRVRIEGGLPPRADTVTPRPLDLASAHEVWARRQQPNWRALDTTVAGPVVPPDEAADAFSETTVRVIRRSKGTSLPLEAEAPPLQQPAKELRTPSYSTSWPHDDERLAEAGAATGASHADEGEGAPQAGQATGASWAQPLDPYLDAPIDAAREESAARAESPAAAPTILESDLLSVPSTGGAWREESEAAYRKYQEVEAQEPVMAHVERRQGLLGRLGFGRAGGGRTAPAPAERPRPERRAEPVPRSEGAASGARAAPAPGPSQGAVAGGPSQEASAEVAAPVRAVASPPPEVSQGAPSGAPASGREQRVIVDESVYDVDFDTDVQPHLSAEGAVPSVENDMSTLHDYLNRPDVPAIVRCDELAQRLSISEERVVQAMTRLAEDRERFTPLRGDAYMVRRVR